MADNDNPVDVTEYDWDALVKKVEGKDFYKPPIVYEFGGGKRQFEDSGEGSGVYE